MDTPIASLPVAIVGGGPVGLTAAAHLAARHQPFIVLEAGPDVGATVREWGHVTMFSPWRYTARAGKHPPMTRCRPATISLSNTWRRLATIPRLHRTSG